MSDYWAWNRSLSDLVYGGASAYQPVFLDVEDEVLVAAGTASGMDAGITAEEAEADLVAAVRQPLALAGSRAQGDIFDWYEEGISFWQAKVMKSDEADEPPPIIALLAVFSRAAEQMGQDRKISDSNYYTRLLQLLDIPKSQHARFKRWFGKDSEGMWDVLNKWLEACDYVRGRPTAYAFGFRYVGIPMSQALVRDADRRQFPEMFRELGLDPGMSLATSDMGQYLKEWVGSRGHGTSQMRHALKSELGRTVLSDAACGVLLIWDGITTDDQHQGLRSPKRKLCLTASIRQEFLSPPRLNLGIALRTGVGVPPGVETIWRHTSSETGSVIRFVGAEDGLAFPAAPVVDADPTSLLDGNVEFRQEVSATDGAYESTDIRAERLSRPVIVMVKGIDGRFVEVDRVRMGEEHLILAREGAGNRGGKCLLGPGGAKDVCAFIKRIAMDGFRRLAVSDISGLPDDWVIYRNVVVMSQVETPYAELEPLRVGPVTTLMVGDGLRLPGRGSRWMTGVPLTFRASVDSIGISVRVNRVDPVNGDIELKDWVLPDASEMVKRVKPLPPNRYRLELRQTSGRTKKTAIRSVSFSVVSADAPQDSPEGMRLFYGDNPEASVPGELGATAGAKELRIAGAQRVSSPDLPPARRTWSNPPMAREDSIEMGPVSPNSCAITGAHRLIQVKQVQSGDRRQYGTCQACGLVITYPLHLRKSDLGEEVGRQTPLLRLPKLCSESPLTGPDLVRALTWMQGGKIAELSNLLRTVEDSALISHDLMRTLESLQVINIERDQSMAPTAWSVVPAALCQSETETWLVTGALNDRQFRIFEKLSAEQDQGTEFDLSDWLPRLTVKAGEQRADEIAEMMEIPTVTNSHAGLLQKLRPISEVGRDLHRFTSAGLLDSHMFSLADCSWQQVAHNDVPGLFRIDRDFTRSYYFRDDHDVDSGTAAWVDPYLGKHLAAQLKRTPLIAYNEERMELVLPLGADLPGLYSRGATLASGWVAQRVKGDPVIAYGNVSAHTAAMLNALLMD